MLCIVGLSLQLFAQEIQGYILDSLSSAPLEYASIGILNTRYGTITDQQGIFHLEVPDLDPESMVRISMIGYKAQSFSLKELQNKKKTH